MTWVESRLKYVCADAGQYGLNISADKYTTSGVRLIRTSDVTPDGALRPDDDGVFVDIVPESGHIVKAGDILLSRSGTLGRAFLVPPEASGATYAGFLVRFRPRPGVDPRFVYYSTQSRSFQETVNAEAVSSTIQNFNAERYANLHLWQPSIEEQRRIADFLDAETSRIDAVTFARKAQLGRLDQREGSLLADRIGELSGGDIRAKFLVELITSGPRGWGDLLADNGTPFLRIANLPKFGIDLDLRDVMSVNAPEGPERERTRTRSGDVLVSITAAIGFVGVVDDLVVDGNVSQHVALMRPNLEVCDPRWLAYALKSEHAVQQLASNSYGGTKIGLSLNDVANVVLPNVDLGEQRRVVAAIDTQRAITKRLRSVIERQLTLLAERRQSLITAAVTGQFDVTTASGRNLTQGV